MKKFSLISIFVSALLAVTPFFPAGAEDQETTITVKYNASKGGLYRQEYKSASFVLALKAEDEGEGEEHNLGHFTINEDDSQQRTVNLSLSKDKKYSALIFPESKNLQGVGWHNFAQVLHNTKDITVEVSLYQDAELAGNILGDTIIK